MTPSINIQNKWYNGNACKTWAQVGVNKPCIMVMANGTFGKAVFKQIVRVFCVSIPNNFDISAEIPKLSEVNITDITYIVQLLAKVSA